MRTCELKGCYEKHIAKGLCQKHYDKEYRKTHISVKMTYDWEKIMKEADIQFEEWKKTAKPFIVDKT